MRTKTKIWLIAATSLVLIGCLLFMGVMTTLKWDFIKLSTAEYEKNPYEIDEAFDSISIKSATADIVFAPSDDGKCRVECYEEEDAKHSVTVKDETLTIELIDERTVYDFIGYIGLNFDTPKITVYLPKNEYTALSVEESTGDIEMPDNFTFKDADISLSTGCVDFYASVTDMLKIKTSTGNIKVKNISVGALELSSSTGSITAWDISCGGDVNTKVSTGDVRLAGINCKNLGSRGSTGDITLKNVIATAKFYVERSTGDIEFYGCDAAEIYVKTNTGDVEGSLRSDKVFFVQTDTGDVEVPKTVNGGKCEIITDTGDIEVDVE